MRTLECIIVLFSFCLVGCSNYSLQTPLDSALTTPVSRSTAHVRSETALPMIKTSAPTIEYTKTRTELLIPKISSTPTPEISLIPIDIISTTLKNIPSEGILVLQDFSKEIDLDYILIDLTSGLVKLLDLKSGISVTRCGPVSPDQERLVCKSKGRLLILDPQGKLLTSVPWKQYWWMLLGWLDNDRILIQKKEPPLATTIIYDPFKNVEEEIPPDYPNISNLEPFNNFGNFSTTAAFYDPTLDYVVYESLNNTDVVFDRTLNKIIAEIPIGKRLNPYPQWSPDGQMVVLGGKRNRPDLSDKEQAEALDIYLVSRSGEIKQATHLSTYFSNPEVSDISWSPDGRLIAFQLYTDDPVCVSYCLMILDPETLSLRGYQLPAGYIGQAADFPVYRQTWSPDSRQLLWNVSEYSNTHNPFLLLLDVYTNKAFIVAKNVRILGWMNSSP